MLKPPQIKKALVPVLWFDTSFIWNNLGDLDFWREVFELISFEEVILLDTGQYVEMLERYSDTFKPNGRSLQIMSSYLTLVKPHKATDHVSFLQRQTLKTMKAYVNQDDLVIYSFDDLFDPFLSEIAPLLDIRNEVNGEKWGTQRAYKTISFDLANDWQLLKERLSHQNITIDQQRQYELEAQNESVIKIIKMKNPTKIKNFVRPHLSDWKKVSENSDLSQLLQFLKSDYYKAIPYVEVHSWLVADLVTSKKSRRIMPSDYFDTIMISMAYPFADFMVVDADMQHRINNRLKLPSRYTGFGSKLINPKEMRKVIKSFKKTTKS